MVLHGRLVLGKKCPTKRTSNTYSQIQSFGLQRLMCWRHISSSFGLSYGTLLWHSEAVILSLNMDRAKDCPLPYVSSELCEVLCRLKWILASKGCRAWIAPQFFCEQGGSLRSPNNTLVETQPNSRGAGLSGNPPCWFNSQGAYTAVHSHCYEKEWTGVSFGFLFFFGLHPVVKLSQQDSGICMRMPSGQLWCCTASSRELRSGPNAVESTPREAPGSHMRSRSMDRVLETLGNHSINS